MESSKILLEFRPSPEQVRALRAVKRTKAGKHKVGRSLIDNSRRMYLSDQGLLYLALRFRINKIELLGSEDDPWKWVPVDVIPKVWMAIHDAAAVGRSDFEFDQTQLRFETDGSTVFVQSRTKVVKVIGGTATGVDDPTLDRRASVPLESLIDAWGTLMDDVRIYLLRELPELVDNYDLGGWLNYGRDAVLR
jgi:hypothetical protein